MLVFLKNPTTGEFEKSGFFPEDCRAMIATDTNKPAGDYTLEDALALVQDCIAKGKKYYRYEIHSTTASQLKHKAKPKPAPKARRAVKSAPKAKKETGHERRLRLIREHKCTACGKRAPRKSRRECKECADYYRDWAKAAAKKVGRK